MWNPDGWDAQKRIGLLIPHADVGPESEFRAMAPSTIGVHGTRVPFGAMADGGAMDPTIPLAPVRAFAELPWVDDAAELLAAAPVHALAFAFTSSAYVIGGAAEVAMIERLSGKAHGLPVVATCAATVDALRLLGAERIAQVDPPWFDAELSGLGRAYYEAAGFNVTFSAPCDLPSDQTRIRPDELFEWIKRSVPGNLDALVIGGNGFRAVGVIDAVERERGHPVITANQVLLWAALRAAGAPTEEVLGYGGLFGEGGTAPTAGTAR
jgi:maleate isomerase